MAIPALGSDGLLPPGRHAATLPEIADVFVERAPNRDRRRLIFAALEVYADLITGLLPGARLWINGGFVTHKAAAPKDVDLVVVVDPTTPAPPHHQLLALLTLQNVVANGSAPVPSIQPMGGLLDAYLAVSTDVAQLDYWDNWWGRVNGGPPGAVKGYLEVTL